MPNFAKSWCVHPCHDIIDPNTGKKKFVKNGKKPTHPCGIHRIDAATAAHINSQYSLITESTLKQVHDGDKICTSCLRKISNEQFQYDNNETDVIESMSVDVAEWSNYDNNNHEEIINENGYEEVDDIIEDLLSSQEQRHKREEVRRKLNIIFKLLNIPTIRDM